MKMLRPFALRLVLVLGIVWLSGVPAWSAGVLNGQLWFAVQGGITDIIDGHVNSDGSNITTTHLNAPSAGPGPQDGASDLSIGLDLPADLYFVVNSDGLSISAHRASTGVRLDSLQIGDFNGSAALQDIVNALAVDPINHFVYVGRWGETQAESGIVRVSYNVTTGDLDNSQAYNASQTRLVNGTQAGGITDVRYITLAGNFLYYSDNDNNYNIAPFVPKNGIYRIDLTNPAAGATLLSSQAQFPTNLSAGLIGTVTVNVAQSLIYFTTHQFNAGGASTAQDALWYMPITGGTATKMTLPANALHYAGEWGGLVFDRQTRQLHLSDQADPTTAADRHITQLQLDAPGTGITGAAINTHAVDALVGHTADPNAYPTGLAFNLLPVFTKTDLGTHPVEQVAAVDIISGPGITDADGDRLAGASIVVTNSFVGSGDDLFVLDGATPRTSGTFTGTAITVARTTDGSGNQTLTLTGYDTFANYQTVVDAARFFANGNNPTNYGANITRTIRWTVSDGAPNVPFGGQNSAATTITIDAVNDAPVNAVPGAQVVNEDTNLAIPGLSISDVDANPATQAMTTMLAVGNGTLTVAPAGGAAVTGSGTATVTLTGTRNQINTTLAAAGNIVYKGVLNYFGSDTLTVTTNDGGNTGSGGALQDVDTVGITVNPVNDAPTLNAIVDPEAILEDAAQQTVNLAGISTGGGETQTLTVAATSNNQAVIPNPTVTYTSADATGSLAYTPVANQSGSAVITVTVMDNGGTANGGVNTIARTFTVNVTPVNDVPTLNAIANPPTIPQDSPQQMVNLSGIGAGPNETQTLTITAMSGNAGLIPNPTVTYTSPNATGSLAYTPVAGQSGMAVITVTVMDNGGTANAGVDSFQRTFTVNVSAPNVAPQITGQNTVTTPQETARTIVFGDLLVTDPDNTYPTGFTLTVMDGTNYTRIGNEITPIVGYTGPLSVPVKVNDGISDSNTFSLAITVTPPITDPTATLLYAKGDAVPGAGNPGGAPAGSVFASFGVPAINDNVATTIAFLGKYKSDAGSGAAIFAGPGSAVLTVAKLGDEASDATGAAMAGVTFKTFKDPVLARDGSVAFLAKLEGATVTKGDDYAIFTNTGGTLKLVAREGATLPGAPALSEVKQFASASLSSEGGDAWVIFTASLVTGPSGGAGPGGVTKADDTGAWRWKASTGVTTNILRENSVLSGVSTSAVKSFRLLKSSGGSPGQSRGQYAGPNATFQVVFLDKTQALVDSDETGVTKVFATGEATVPDVVDATWKSFGAPAVPAVAGTGLAFLSQLNKDLGGVTSTDAKRLFFSPTAGVGAMAKTSDVAPGMGGTALFSLFKDPVLSPGGNLFAFLGGAKGTGVTKGTDSGIWRGAASGVITLAAQEGTAPPDLDPAARFKSFSSVAASDKGPVFVAKLITGVGGTTSASDIGLWGTTTSGAIRKLLAEGDTLDTKTVKVFTVLKAASGSQGVRRSFAAHGTVVVRVNFTDGSSALYEIDVP